MILFDIYYRLEGEEKTRIAQVLGNGVMEALSRFYETRRDVELVIFKIERKG